MADTFVLDGLFARVPAADIMVTPSSGTETTLGAALATAQVTGGAINGATIGATTPSTGAFTTVTATGDLGAKYAHGSAATTLTAAGTSRTDALALAAQINNLTTVAASTGALLPTVAVGNTITVFNNGANAVQIYAAGSQTIDGVAGATGVPLTNAKRCEFSYIATNTWLSAQLGVVSA